MPGPEYEVMLRAWYFDYMARCALNETCAGNYRLGNRKAQVCHACSLKEVFSDERRAETYTVIDTVHEFYERLGIRGGGKDIAPMLLFRERLIHTIVVATVQNHSRKLANDLFDPAQKSLLGGGTLLTTIL